MNGAAIMTFVAKVIKDYMTDATGNVYSIGRALGVVLFLLGLLFPMVLGVFLALTSKPTMAEWVSFMGALGIYFPTLVASVVLLITGSAPVDPGGRWWAKSNEPPPVEPPPKGGE